MDDKELPSLPEMKALTSDEQIQMLIAAERHRRETPREREIKNELAKLCRELNEEYRTRAQPLLDELVDIEGRKPPFPFLVRMGDDVIQFAPGDRDGQ